jgi:hypothetical protein
MWLFCRSLWLFSVSSVPSVVKLPFCSYGDVRTVVIRMTPFDPREP